MTDIATSAEMWIYSTLFRQKAASTLKNIKTSYIDGIHKCIWSQNMCASETVKCSIDEPDMVKLGE